MTASELACLIEENLEDDWDAFLVGRDVVVDGVPGVLTAQPVEMRKGQELREVILRWNDPAGGTRFFRKTGCYNSWDGTVWDGSFDEVFPREVVRMEWVAV